VFTYTLVSWAADLAPAGAQASPQLTFTPDH
jgi:hypothetical protein